MAMAMTTSMASFCSPSSTPIFSSNLSPSPVKLRISISSAPSPSFNYRSGAFTHLPLSIIPIKTLLFPRFSATHEIATEEKPPEEIITEPEIRDDKRRKLFVFNLPFSYTAPDIKNLFSESGTVQDVELIKLKDGRNKGYAFITMASAEEARAAIMKFNSFDVQGRIIQVDFAKTMKKPPVHPKGSTGGETRHKIYVSNLAWKARVSNLREFFATSSNPVTARVVFDTPLGRPTGYGFVSFATKEEAEAAISALDGKELMGRPVHLKMSQRNADESETETKEEDSSEGQKEI